jgi:hypothetical protein
MKKMRGFRVLTVCLTFMLMALGLVFVSCKEPETTTYTVIFNANGGIGTVPDLKTVQAGSGITLPSGSGLSRNNYTFGGWNASADGT